jgi:hypothetical protein
MHERARPRAGQGDFMFNGREWLPCPNPDALLARGVPIKVYAGMSLELLNWPIKLGPPNPAERPKDDDP